MNNVDMTRLVLSFLGTFEVNLEEQPITRFRSANNQGLLVYLALNSDKSLPREVLATLFWPEETEKNARHNLRQALYQLRTLLGDTKNKGEPFLTVTRHTARLNPGSDYVLDVRQFLDAIEANDLETAVAHYHGDLLPGFTCDSLQFEVWLRQERESAHQLALGAMSEVTQDHLGAGRLDKAQAIARRQLILEPWREAAYHQLMLAYAMAGDRSNALAQYEACRAVLWDELGIEPAQETVALFEEIEAGQYSAIRLDEQLRPPVVVHHNLPAETTIFIGRKTEMATLDAFIAEPNVRLVTIVGSGGMGKTRLALACAQRQVTAGSSFPDGVFFVDLSPLSEAEQMVSALAEALDFSLQGGDGRSPRQQLLDYLSHKEMLLLFDNFEHLLAGGGLLAEIVQAAPKTKILVTSQQRLHLQLEQVYPIDGLEFPETISRESSQTAGNAADYAAAQLFIQSARRNQPDFALRDGADLTHLVRICRLVAGMPLALELAASWVDMLPLAEIEAELLQGLDFLETEMRDMPERHRSVRAAIDYSWQKLEEKERVIFVRLSIFSGGFTREAAIAVAGANLRRLGRLVNKSFLQYYQAVDRYQVHGLLRQYGAEKLAEDRGHEKTVRGQHSSFYNNALQQWEAELKSGRWLTAVDDIEADYRNIVLAWEEALSRGNLDLLISAVNGLGDYYDATGRWLEGIDLFHKSATQLQPKAGDLPTTPKSAQLFIWLSAWQVHLYINVKGDDIVFEDVYQRLLKPILNLFGSTILADIDSRTEEAFLRLQLGRVLKYIDGKWEEGIANLHVCMRLYRDLGDLLGESDALYESQFYYAYGQRQSYEEAEQMLQACLLILRRIGEPRRLNRALLGKGILARNSKAFSEAADLYEQAYQTAQAAGYLIGMWDARHVAMNQGWHLGQFDLAHGYAEEMYNLAQQANSPNREATAMMIIGLTQVYRGQFLPALDLFQKAFENRDRGHLPTEPGFYDGIGVPLAQLHSGYYQEIVSAVESEGRSWRMSWVYLARKEYAKALALAQNLLARLPAYARAGQPELRAAMALALHGLNRIDEARKELYQGLQTAVKVHEFNTLMQLMPVLPVLLADTADVKHRERAVELWAMAESVPFVGNSRLYADLIGRHIADVAATLPTAVASAAQARGRELDWWQTAESLLTELEETGWNLGGKGQGFDS